MTETKSPTALAELVGRFMGELHRHDAGRTLPLLQAAQLTTPQLAALEAVREPSTVTDVARALGVSLPATSQMLEKLVRKKLVLRQEAAQDRRSRAVVASARGRRLLERLAAARAARFDASLSRLAPPLRARLEAVLTDVVAVLGEARGGGAA